MPKNSVLAKAPYKIPEVVDTDRVCIVVRAPNDPVHLANFFAALSTLGLWSNYRLEADRIAKPVADVWDEIYIQSEQEMCNCSLRNGPNGIEQFDPETNTWTPIQGNSEEGDPRTDGSVPPPWPDPPEGETGNCLAAANITDSFRSSMKQFVTTLEIEAGFAVLLVGIETLLALALPIIGEVVVIATAMASAALDAGFAEMKVSFIDEPIQPAYDALTCSINCFIASDGTITTSDIASIKANFHAKLPALMDDVEEALWTLFVDDFFDANGPNGLMKFGKLANITHSDCDDCDCSTWTRELFAGHDNVAQGTLISFEGCVASYDVINDWIEGCQNGVDTAYQFDMVFDFPVTLTSFKVEYDSNKTVACGNTTDCAVFFDEETAFTRRITQSGTGHIIGSLDWAEGASVTTFSVRGDTCGGGGGWNRLTHIVLKGTGTPPF